MKKQFAKIKIAAENLSRSTKPDCKDFELEIIEKQVEKYRDVLDKMVRKLPAVSTTTDSQERDKRIRKNSHYKIGQALEESSRELSKDMPLQHVLANCGELEKSIAECTVDSELQTENEVVRRLKLILDNEIQEISTTKRNVSRTVQEYASLTRHYESARKLDEPQSKIDNLKSLQEECEVKLEKERDTWAAQMFELIAKEDEIVQCIRDYVLNQRNYHERALLKVNSSLANIQDIIQSTVKSRFGTSLSEQLASTNREISYILELCVCCLVEHGLCEEGLLRVGCASTKLRRMKHALEAQYVKTPLPTEYQDPHVIGSILKLYLRELPEPLLTYKYYKDFIRAAERGTEAERKADIKTTINKLPKENYINLRYLTKFLWLVTQNVDYNKMSSHNLAIVMSPNMLWQRIDKNTPADYVNQVSSSSIVNRIVELLISDWDYFFDGDVDFFVTLQRNKLFVEGKSKSNSSNENLDKHDNDSIESPRYGTIRRQKAYAPSPPAKLNEKSAQSYQNSTGTPQIVHTTADANAASNGNGVRNGEIINFRGKELFPATSSMKTSIEKPEKPPLPKVLQLQNLNQPQQQQQQTTSSTSSTSQQQEHNAATQTPQRPVPMTRTQFFGLDNLPSPVADRRSNESGSDRNSLTFKPELPQKPKIAKRPMVLGLNTQTSSKSEDEDSTPTQTSASLSLGSENYGHRRIASSGNGGYVKTSTEKFIEKLRNETNCDNNTTKKTDENLQQQKEVTTDKTTPTSTSGGGGGSSISNSNSTSIGSSNMPPPPAIPTAITTASTNNNQDHQNQISQTRQTPTTPISPNTILTPKRPTVPAPPPPSIVKKQIDQ